MDRLKLKLAEPGPGGSAAGEPPGPALDRLQEEERWEPGRGGRPGQKKPEPPRPGAWEQGEGEEV